MSLQTAKVILKRHGLSGFDVRELSGLLNDKYKPLPADVKLAILTIRKG